MGLEAVIDQSGLRFSRLYAGDVDADVIVLGNSRAVNAVLPPMASALSGKRTFSLAHNGLSMRLCEALLRDYLDNNSAPEVVLIEVSNLTVGDDAVQNLRMYYDQSERLRSLAAESDSIGFKATRISQLYSYNNDLFLRALFYMSRSDQNWSNGYSITEEWIQKWRDAPVFEAEPILENQVVALRQILTLLREKNIRPILFIGPYLPEYVSRWANNASWVATIQNAALVPVWDYSSLFDNHSYFADHHHLSRKGSRALFKEMLADHGLGYR